MADDDGETMTMPSKHQEVAESKTSPLLFVTVDGEPMSFFMRPGPVKRRLQPLIASGGGTMCKVQRPGAILLIDQDERGCIPETTARWYVATKYIHDCIEEDKQLNIEDYRLNPEDIPKHSTRLNNSREGSSGQVGGRVAYSPEEDAAILSYVSKHKTETGGNRLWQEMEKQHVTSHSWQSMKYRYRVQLAKKHTEAEKVQTTEGETKEEKQETDIAKPSSEKAAPPQILSPAPDCLQTDLTQVDAQPIPAESTQLENLDAETSNLPQPGEPCVDTQGDARRIPAESTEPEATDPQTINSPQKESAPEDSPQSLRHTLTPKEPVEKQVASPELERRQQHRLTRRQLELEASSSPVPYGKKHRSLSVSPRPAKETESAVKPAIQIHTTIDPPPSKRARVQDEAAAAESQQVESAEAAVCETPRADPAADQASTRSNPEPGPSLQEKPQQAQVLSSDGAAEMGCPQPQPQPQPQPAASDPAPTEASHAASGAHRFIFDSESQEEDSQSLIGDRATALPNPQPLVNEDAALSLTQVHLEEDVQRITALMNHTNEDIVVVTKALLKTSGDFAAALDLLSNPSVISGPFWNHHDDGLLLSADPVVRQQLQEKYVDLMKNEQMEILSNLKLRHLTLLLSYVIIFFQRM
ncbi:hypothetical protein F2P81_012218 [Scophthalmus maximus]|uniref:Telomeric repeat-binding factor 2-interacting protein 1 n=1 Tax=Scophthalmus maximus TaxID=52904 RepID=A0A6A4SRC9_SCOMX|nr:hypothetical protein F2P81_012218 [Scophthalmus maximus]